jgi:hypothetical protein
VEGSTWVSYKVTRVDGGGGGDDNERPPRTNPNLFSAEESPIAGTDTVEAFLLLSPGTSGSFVHAIDVRRQSLPSWSGDGD